MLGKVESLIETPLYPLGDKIGEVTLLDKMGSDLGIANAARVSYMGESKGEKADRKLVHYLYRHQHWTPFRQQVMKIRVKCPLFTARQWRTHQWADYEDIQWVFNEQSGRYVEMPEEFYISEARRQATKNKQGSTGCSTDSALQGEWNLDQRYALEKATSIRNISLRNGVAKELANRILPQTVYTSFVWTVNLHSLFNFLNMRTDEYAQWEIRRYASTIALMLAVEFPWAYECWKRYKMVVIDSEQETVVQLPKDDPKDWERKATYDGVIKPPPKDIHGGDYLDILKD